VTVLSIELRSDTFTRPTPAMREAMYRAEVGDDVWNEDPTVHRLEQRAAELMGKERAMFVSSGTQGNLIGLLTHTRRGDEVVVGDQSHIFHYEVAGPSVVGGLQVRTLPNTGGHLDPQAVRDAIRETDVHMPRTGCVALENTHNRCGGAVLRRGDMRAVVQVARDHGIPVHLDGARVWNAAIALDVPMAELVKDVDSVTFCLSKALGAPVGSLLCGPADYIEEAHRYRKMLGGGMRQVGILAAAGLVALNDNVNRLVDDHANARRLAEGMAQMPGINIDPTTVESNIVIADVSEMEMDRDQFILKLLQRGVRIADFGGNLVRAVTSYEVNETDIDHALKAMYEVTQDTALAYV